uniref:SGNH hydrolase-type esterase domain-containing protein n=1 Tax=Alexandrium monilatum TaxID=311494 RepID=A0A6T1D4R8_9DINO
MWRPWRGGLLRPRPRKRREPRRRSRALVALAAPPAATAVAAAAPAVAAAATAAAADGVAAPLLLCRARPCALGGTTQRPANGMRTFAGGGNGHKLCKWQLRPRSGNRGRASRSWRRVAVPCLAVRSGAPAAARAASASSARGRSEHRRTSAAHTTRHAVSVCAAEDSVEVVADEAAVRTRLPRPSRTVSPPPATHAISPARERASGRTATPTVARRGLSLVRTVAAARASGPSPPPLSVLNRMPVSFHSSLSSPPCGGTGRPHRILCYGDSLTVGFSDEGRRYEPYGRALSEALGGLVAAGCEVSICGHSGHTAAEMVAHLDAAVVEDVGGMIGKGLRRILEEEPTPDLVLLMAGTNDIGRDSHPQAILDDICRLHAVCHACGVRTVALVPPPAPRTAAGSAWETRRRQLAGLLTSWARSGHASGVAALLEPGELVPSAKGSCLWDPDGLHLAPAGSWLLGQRLALRIAPMLPSNRALVKSSSADTLPQQTAMPLTQHRGRAKAVSDGFREVPESIVKQSPDTKRMGKVTGEVSLQFATGY